MTTQFITDDLGNKLAIVLPIKKYEALLDELEELEDIKLFDQAKKEDNGERISLDDYMKNRFAK